MAVLDLVAKKEKGGCHKQDVKDPLVVKVRFCALSEMYM